MLNVLTEEEIAASLCETGEIRPSKTLDFEIVVVGAGAAGVPAAPQPGLRDKGTAGSPRVRPSPQR